MPTATPPRACFEIQRGYSTVPVVPLRVFTCAPSLVPPSSELPETYCSGSNPSTLPVLMLNPSSVSGWHHMGVPYSPKRRAGNSGDLHANSSTPPGNRWRASEQAQSSASSLAAPDFSRSERSRLREDAANLGGTFPPLVQENRSNCRNTPANATSATAYSSMHPACIFTELQQPP